MHARLTHGVPQLRGSSLGECKHYRGPTNLLMCGMLAAYRDVGSGMTHCDCLLSATRLPLFKRPVALRPRLATDLPFPGQLHYRRILLQVHVSHRPIWLFMLRRCPARATIKGNRVPQSTIQMPLRGPQFRTVVKRPRVFSGISGFGSVRLGV